MTQIETFERQEATALEGLDADLQSVARTSPERTATISAAQVADLAASDDGRKAREAARIQAIEADAAARTGRAGRPPISAERAAYRSLCEEHDEAPDIYKVAWGKYAEIIEQLKQAGPVLDELQTQAGEQMGLAAQVVRHLKDAAETFAESVKLADAGKAVMARLGELVAFNDSPFMDLMAGPRELHDLHKRWALRLAAETARLGKGEDAELVAQREKRADAEYRKQLEKAAVTYRKVPDGKRLWSEYRQVVKDYAAGQAERPEEDLSGVRDQAQRLLRRFYGAAAGHANLEFKAEAVPQVA